MSILMVLRRPLDVTEELRRKTEFSLNRARRRTPVARVIGAKKLSWLTQTLNDDRPVPRYID
jgi:hypothetical protein